MNNKICPLCVHARQAGYAPGKCSHDEHRDRDRDHDRDRVLKMLDATCVGEPRAVCHSIRAEPILCLGLCYDAMVYGHGQGHGYGHGIFITSVHTHKQTYRHAHTAW